MAILSIGTDFATGEQVTAARLDALVDNATFASGAVDGSTTQLNGSGAIIVKDGGITSAKLNLSATGQSQTIASFNTTQTDSSGNQVGRSVKINTPAADDLGSPFEFETLNAFVFKVDDHTVTIDSDGKTIFGNGSTPSSKSQVNIATDDNLGSTSGNTQSILALSETAGSNLDSLLFTSQRTANGSDFSTAAHRIQRKVDATKMGYIQFGHHSATNGNTITFGENETERMRIDAEGHVGIGTTTPSEALEVSGNILATNGTESVQLANNGSIEIRHSSGPFIDFKNADENRDCRIFQTSDGLGFQVGGSSAVATKMLLASDGDVGIGTTSPDGNLHVVGAAGDKGRIFLADADNGSGQADSLALVKDGVNASVVNRDGGYLQLGANNSPFVTLSSGGNVGINKASPTEKLHIDSGNIKVVNGGTVHPNNHDGGLLQLSNSDASHRLSLDPNEILCKDTLSIRVGHDKDIKFQNVNSAGDGTVDLMYIDSSAARVGIGTTSPSSELEVVGDVRANSITAREQNDSLLIKSDPEAPDGSNGGSLIQLFSQDSGNASQHYQRATYHHFSDLNGNHNLEVDTVNDRVNVTGRLEFDALKGTGSTEVTNILDQDNMSSNSASALATQQSIRAFTAMSPIQNGSGGGYTGGESVTFPNGLILKMGKTGDVVQDGDTAVSFDGTFPNEIISLVITKEGAKNVGGNGEITASSVSTSGFVFNNGSDSTGKCNYMAMGR